MLILADFLTFLILQLSLNFVTVIACSSRSTRSTHCSIFKRPQRARPSSPSKPQRSTKKSQTKCYLDQNEFEKMSLSPWLSLFYTYKIVTFMQLPNCHYKIVTFLQLPICHYQIVTYMYLPNCHNQIVVTKLSPYQVGIIKLSLPIFPYQIDIVKTSPVANI